MAQPSIPGYEILSKVAEGGMATVWKAKQLSLDRLVALKVLSTGLIEREEDIARFRREAQSAAKLRHPGLCEIYDAGETDGIVYYVMEYVAGFSVGELLARKGDLSEKQALMIAYGVATTLGAIWEKNRVIHCDIKPDNILIDQDGMIRITDLGLARIIGHMALNLDSEYIVGTPNYASPEQAAGLDDLDCRTDMYALGATLYHMLTGLMPFGESDGEEAMERHLHDSVADPQKINTTISNGAAWLVEKLMVKDRNARYADWDEVLKDLEEVRAGRLPRGDLPPSGQSTVMRSEEREAATRTEIQAMKPKTPKVVRAGATKMPSGGAVKSPAALQVKPRLQKSAATAHAERTDKKKKELGATLRKTYSLALLVVAAYAGTFYLVGRGAVQADVQDPEVAAPAPTPALPSPVRRAEPRPEPVRPAIVTPSPAPAPAPATAPTPAPTLQPELARPVPAPVAEEEEAWDHPDYVEAMRLLRQADARFQEFVRSRDQSLLTQIEPDCRKAIELFESIRTEAPVRARVGERIRQSYQLIANTRQSRIMNP